MCARPPRLRWICDPGARLTLAAIQATAGVKGRFPGRSPSSPTRNRGFPVLRRCRQWRLRHHARGGGADDAGNAASQKEDRARSLSSSTVVSYLAHEAFAGDLDASLRHSRRIRFQLGAGKAGVWVLDSLSPTTTVTGTQRARHGPRRRPCARCEHPGHARRPRSRRPAGQFGVPHPRRSSSSPEGQRKDRAKSRQRCRPAGGARRRDGPAPRRHLRVFLQDREGMSDAAASSIPRSETLGAQEARPSTRPPGTLSAMGARTTRTMARARFPRRLLFDPRRDRLGQRAGIWGHHYRRPPDRIPPRHPHGQGSGAEFDSLAGNLPRRLLRKRLGEDLTKYLGADYGDLARTILSAGRQRLEGNSVEVSTRLRPSSP